MTTVALLAPVHNIFPRPTGAAATLSFDPDGSYTLIGTVSLPHNNTIISAIQTVVGNTAGNLEVDTLDNLQVRAYTCTYAPGTSNSMSATCSQLGISGATLYSQGVIAFTTLVVGAEAAPSASGSSHLNDSPSTPAPTTSMPTSVPTASPANSNTNSTPSSASIQAASTDSFISAPLTLSTNYDSVNSIGPSPNASPSTLSDNTSHTNLQTSKAWIGGVVGGILIVVAIVVGFVCLRRRRLRLQKVDPAVQSQPCMQDVAASGSSVTTTHVPRWVPAPSSVSADIDTESFQVRRSLDPFTPSSFSSPAISATSSKQGEAGGGASENMHDPFDGSSVSNNSQTGTNISNPQMQTLLDEMQRMRNHMAYLTARAQDESLSSEVHRWNIPMDNSPPRYEG